MSERDCDRCYGTRPLTFCEECQAWLCNTCQENHSCESFYEQRQRQNMVVFNQPIPAAKKAGEA